MRALPFAAVVIAGLTARVRADDQLYVSGVTGAPDVNKAKFPLDLVLAYEHQTGDLAGGGSYGREVFDLLFGAVVPVSKTSFDTPVLVSFWGDVRGGGAGDFVDPKDNQSLGFTMGMGILTGFVFPLIRSDSFGTSFEVGLDTFVGYGDWGHWKVPPPWEDRSHVAGRATLHTGVKLGDRRLLGLDATWTPLVAANGPYDDINQIRVGLRLDLSHLILRADYAKGSVRGSELPKHPMLDGHEQVVTFALGGRFY